MPRSLLDRLRIARSAMQQLTEDPDRTEMVFEITEALAGRQPERLLRRIECDPAGVRLLAERPAFDPEHCDLDALMQLPEGSFGRTFAEWMKENEFAPGLMQRDFDGGDPDLAYLGQRLTQVHDFWHVLSGYNRDPIGELGVLMFGWAQMHSYGIGYILGTILLRNLRETWRAGKLRSPLAAYLWRAYRAGRRARFLAPLVLEDLFPLPLPTVREMLRIEPLTKPFVPEGLPPIAAPLAA